MALCLAPAARADILLSSPSGVVSPDAPFAVRVTVTNTGADPQEVDLPARLQAEVESGGKLRVLVLTRPAGDGTDAHFTLAPGAFRTEQYTGELPRGFLGTIVLRTTNLDADPLLLRAARPSTTEPPPLAVSVYEPVYFIAGGDGGLNAKFQISFRYQLFDGRGSLARRIPLLDNLYLGYSQTSLWDLHELSSPFRDSSYRPRLFYADYDIGGSHDGLWHFGFESGFGHESNGKSGADSRSLNSFYARPTLLFGDPMGRRFFIAPTVYSYVDSSPRDIYRHRGYVDWEMGYGSKSSWNIWMTLRQGTAHFGSVEANLSYPLSKRSSGNLSGWLLLQYFDGYGESPLDYDQKLRSQLRLGLAIAL
jgi:outer membrane phospholipase A